MIRIGVKNYVKIIKKFQGDQSVPIVTVLCETFASILDYLETYNNSLPAEYYYEIGLLLKELSDQNDNCPSLLNKRKLFASIEKSKEQSRFDKTTHFWLKRYEPLLSELKKIYSRAESVDGHLNCK